MRRFWAASLFVVGALALGCGGDGLKRVPVEGTVTAKGTPVAKATVSFLPAEGTQGEGGIGTTDDQGKFTLTGSRDGAAGVVPGKYKVRLTRYVDRDGTLLPGDAKQADFPNAVESVPAPYSAPESPLEVTVPDAGGAITLDLPVPLLKPKKK